MILTICILSVLLVFAIGIILYLIDILNTSLDQNEQYAEWIIEFQKLVNSTYTKLKNVDDRNLFEKDDDVGFVFTNIVSLIENLKSKL